MMTPTTTLATRTHLGWHQRIIAPPSPNLPSRRSSRASLLQQFLRALMYALAAPAI
jgi:hypothetical protein